MSDQENAVNAVNVLAPDRLSDDTKVALASAPNQRTKASILIALGSYTKTEMAQILDCSVESVSSQMSYLRMSQENVPADERQYIVYGPDRVYRYADVTEFTDWVNSKAPKAIKAKATTPEARSIAVYKAVARITTQLKNLESKKPVLSDALGALENQEGTDAFITAEDNFSEVVAKSTIAEISLRRLEREALTLPSVEDAKASLAAASPKDTDVSGANMATAEGLGDELENESDDLL